MKNIAIYELFNEDLSIRYIGRTMHLYQRFTSHKLDKPWAISIRVLEWTNEKEWRKAEEKWISIYKNLGIHIVNKNTGGGGPLILSDSHKQAISRGNYGLVRSKEARLRMSLASRGVKKLYPNPRKGIILSEITKLKISLKLKGRKLSQETREKMKLSQIKRWKNKNT